jgi:hypothetical protein
LPKNYLQTNKKKKKKRETQELFISISFQTNPSIAAYFGTFLAFH